MSRSGNLKSYTLLKNVKVYFTSAAFRAVCVFFSGVLIAKVLGATDRGVVGIVTSVAMFSSISGSLGLPQLVSIHSTSFLARNPRLIFSSILAAALSCMIAATYHFFTELQYLLQLVAITLLYLTTTLSREVLRGEGLFKRVSTSFNIESFCVVMIALWAYVFGLNAMGYLNLIVLANTLVAGSTLSALYQLMCTNRDAAYGEILPKTQITFSLVNLLIPIVKYSSLPILAILGAPAPSIGVAAVAFSMVNNLEIIPNSLNQVLLPSLKKKDISEEGFQLLIYGSIFTSIIAVLFFYLFVEMALAPFLGPEYSQLDEMLLILGIGFSVGGVGKIINLKLNLISQEYYELKALMVRAITQFAMMLFLYGLYGINGALFAISLSQIFRFIYCGLIYQKTYGFQKVRLLLIFKKLKGIFLANSANT